MKVVRWSGYILVLLLLPLGAIATVDLHEFDDPQAFRRFKTLTEELRCPKCQNQAIADSNAPIANDLREEVYRLLQAGRSDSEIVDFMQERYGDFVLYKPRLSLSTILLWFGPLLFLGAGVATLWVMLRRNRRADDGARELTADELRRLKQLMAGREES